MNPLDISRRSGGVLSYTHLSFPNILSILHFESEEDFRKLDVSESKIPAKHFEM